MATADGRLSGFPANESSKFTRHDIDAEFEVEIENFKFSESDCKVPVFRPTIEEFSKGLSNYISEHVENSDAAKVGLVKIIPPREWSWCERFRTLEDRLMLKDIAIKPIKQHTVGARGVFRLDLEETKTMTPAVFKAKAESDQMKMKLSVKDEDQPRNLEFYESKFWKSIIGSSAPTIYGSDTEGTLFDDNPHSGWNFNDLESLMVAGFDYSEKKDAPTKPTMQIPGITAPMLYFGMWKTIFGWHSEDLDLFSSNVLHIGDPKVWYTVPRSQNHLFESAAQNLFAEDFNRCSEFLRHKTVLISPKNLKNNGVSVVKAIQRVGEIMVTFPRAYHCGFNCGFNVAEAVNFATPYWIDYGRYAGFCSCENFTVKFSVDAFVQNVRTHNSELLPAEPRHGDLLLVKWKDWKGWHLVRVLNLRKSEKIVDVALVGTNQKKKGRVEEKWEIHLDQDQWRFPTNGKGNRAWPKTDDEIYITLQDREFLVQLKHRSQLNEPDLQKENINNHKRLATVIPTLPARDREQVESESDHLAGEDGENEGESDEEEEEEEEDIKWGLNKAGKVKDLGVENYKDVYAASLEDIPGFGLFSFDPKSQLWRWPDATEMSFIQAQKERFLMMQAKRKRDSFTPTSSSTDKKSRVPRPKEEPDHVHNYNINMNVNNNIFLDKYAQTHQMQPFARQTQQAQEAVVLVVDEEKLWAQIMLHKKKKSEPVVVGDVVLIKWDDWDGEYLVKVGQNAEGGLCVVSALDDPAFGSWDFDPNVDEWKRPKISDLQLLKSHILKNQQEELAARQKATPARPAASYAPPPQPQPQQNAFYQQQMQMQQRQQQLQMQQQNAQMYQYANPYQQYQQYNQMTATPQNRDDFKGLLMASSMLEPHQQQQQQQYYMQHQMNFNNMNRGFEGYDPFSTGAALIHNTMFNQSQQPPQQRPVQNRGQHGFDLLNKAAFHNQKQE